MEQRDQDLLSAADPPTTTSNTFEVEPASSLTWRGALSQAIDIKQWYVGTIRPTFSTAHRQHTEEDPELFPVQKPHRLDETNRVLREHSRSYNAPKETSSKSLFARTCGPMEAGGVRTCSISLAATALGAGALAIPYAFSLVGVGLGIVTLIMAGLVSSLSLQILMIAARYTDSKSYASVLELAVGSRIASFTLDLIVTLNGIGSVTCILIFMGDFVPSVILSPPWGGGAAVHRALTIAVCALAAWPLTWPADISALRYVAVAIPFALIATIIIVAIKTPWHFQQMGGEVIYWDFDPRKWLKAGTIMVNAFANHMNAVPCVNQLESPSIDRIVKGTVHGNALVGLLLLALGLFGYLSWGKTTKGDFILNYPADDTGIWICRVMLSFVVYFVLPVALLPTSKSCAQIILQAFGGGDSQTPLSRSLHISSSTILLVGCTGLAITFEDVSDVIGVLGGFLASSLMFWFPALVFWKLLWRVQPRFLRYPVLSIMLVFGISCWASVIVSRLP